MSTLWSNGVGLMAETITRDGQEVIVLWKDPLIEIIDGKVLINDHVIWLKGSYFDVNGEHWVE